ncbi:DoxX family protein [Pedobacter aquatilis]|uniref:DoxX family protein n=1 Tax=Pedobacter aquatilis TaxID=351343 RepID=UPI002930D276|nr:DoxX family protein [Pedobacter aquatilis]
MKRDKIIYWVTTIIVALGGLVAGVIYIISPMMAERFIHLGYPDYFRIELASAKIMGAFALTLPIVSNRIKEWAYAGFAIVFISATIAHVVIDGMAQAISPLIQLLFLLISYVYFNKLKDYKSI